MLAETQTKWPGVVALSGALSPLAWFTGHFTIFSLAAGIMVWALGEWEKEIAPVDYQWATSFCRFVFNLAGLSLIAHALYRFWKYGFWPISGLF